MEDPQVTDKCYAVQTIPRKGYGLVARTRIFKGTRLLLETPIFTVLQQTSESIVAEKVNTLDSVQKTAFFALANIWGNTYSKSLGIVKTNVLPLGADSKWNGLFMDASRINHSCQCNAHHAWNNSLKQLTVHALSDIESGQEITISYLPKLLEFSKRQSYLKEKYDFECHCELWSLPIPGREHIDSQIKTLQSLDDGLGTIAWGYLGRPYVLPVLYKKLELCNKGAIWDRSILKAYQQAYAIVTSDGDKTRAGVFAQRTYDIVRAMEGDDSTDTLEMKQAVQDITKQAPQGMNETEFEKWLWMLD
jgi:hypothetical protein